MATIEYIYAFVSFKMTILCTYTIAAIFYYFYVAHFNQLG